MTTDEGNPRAERMIARICDADNRNRTFYRTIAAYLTTNDIERALLAREAPPNE